MPVERSAGIILYRNTPEGRKFLVIRSSRKYPDRPEFWDFPKGRLDSGEDGIGAARREVREEVGIDDFEIVQNFKETVRYFTRREGKSIPKFVAMFLAHTPQKEVTLSWEHDVFEWLAYHDARERVTIPDMKHALDRAEEFLAQQEKEKK